MDTLFLFFLLSGMAFWVFIGLIIFKILVEL